MKQMSISHTRAHSRARTHTHSWEVGNEIPGAKSPWRKTDYETEYKIFLQFSSPILTKYFHLKVDPTTPVVKM